MRRYRLPNRKHTNSQAVYLREWRRFGRAIVNGLAEGCEPGWRLAAFDPDVQLVKQGEAITINGATARALARLGGLYLFEEAQ